MLTYEQVQAVLAAMKALKEAGIPATLMPFWGGGSTELAVALPGIERAEWEALTNPERMGGACLPM